MKLPIRVLAYVCLVGLTHCGNNPLGPTDLVRPKLASLGFEPFYIVWPEQGILAVGGALADSTARLRDDERVAVQVSVASGDSEELLLESALDFPGPTVRTMVAVTMHSPHTVDELAGVIGQIPARWWLICQSRTCGAFRIFDSRRVASAIEDLSDDARVEFVERDVLGFPGDPPTNLPQLLFAAVPMDYGQAQPGDSIVQGQKGDLIEVRYTQPDGSVLVHSIVME
jgi:hypothetical protein